MDTRLCQLCLLLHFDCFWWQARAEHEPPLSCRPSHLSMKQLNMTCFCKWLHFCPDHLMEPWFPATSQTDVTSARAQPRRAAVVMYAFESAPNPNMCHALNYAWHREGKHRRAVWLTEDARSTEGLKLVRERNRTTKSKQLDMIPGFSEHRWQIRLFIPQQNRQLQWSLRRNILRGIKVTSKTYSLLTWPRSGSLIFIHD